LGIVFRSLAFQIGGKEQKGAVIYTAIHLIGDKAQAVINRRLGTFPHVGCVVLTGGLAGDEDRNEEVRVVWCSVVCVCAVAFAVHHASGQMRVA
jgi:hypothetical protein